MPCSNSSTCPFFTFPTFASDRRDRPRDRISYPRHQHGIVHQGLHVWRAILLGNQPQHGYDCRHGVLQQARLGAQRRLPLQRPWADHLTVRWNALVDRGIELPNPTVANPAKMTLTNEGGVDIMHWAARISAPQRAWRATSNTFPATSTGWSSRRLLAGGQFRGKERHVAQQRAQGICFLRVAGSIPDLRRHLGHHCH